MKKMAMWGFAAVSVLFVAACGGGGSGISVTCAPGTLSPITDVTGSWQVAVTNIVSTCPTPPNWITCNVTLQQNDGGEVSLTSSNNCSVNITVEGQTVTSSDYTSISGFGGAVDGTTFYWLANLRTAIDEEGFSYEETDSVTCDTITSFGDGSTSEIATTTTYSSSIAGDGTCTGTATVTFTQI